MKIKIALLAALLFPLQLAAQSFTYNYRGVDFSCKVKDGKAIVKGFDRDAAKVVIPAQVMDKNGLTYKVSMVDLFREVGYYEANTVAIETGITEINDYCFYLFRDLQEAYIPNSIEKVGKKAFNAKHFPSFKKPASIATADLLAGNAIYPHATVASEADPLADLDLSDYGVGMTTKPQGNTLAAAPAPKPVSIKPGTSDIDYNIPSANVKRENTFCVIIANETYGQKDTPNVKYAAQDGKTFYDYCLRTLGLPQDNVRMIPNASYLQMKNVLSWFEMVADAYGKESNFIFYYAGHGVPDEKGNCKLIPSDVSINDVDNGFSLKDLYASLGKLTTNNVLALIDACFSGNDRENVVALDEMHRGIVRRVNQDPVTGNVVVLTAASGTETALSFDEKGHGLFSYYLMKKLQETKGNVTFGELYDYVKREVMRKSVVSKGKKQTPSVSFSGKLTDSWKGIKF